VTLLGSDPHLERGKYADGEVRQSRGMMGTVLCTVPAGLKGGDLRERERIDQKSAR
jgi:hypothetical protein